MSVVTRLKDKQGVFHDIGTKWENIVPIAEKTYTGLVAASNTNGSGADFIMIDLAHDSDIRKLFRLRLRIDAEYKRSNDNVKYTSTHDCLIIGGSGNQSICSAMWNSISNTSYRAIYYLVAYRPTTNTANWKIGVCLYNCNNNTSSTNPRTVTIKVMSQENCTTTFYDTCANTDYATYYKNMTGRSAYNLCDNGLQETGDANTYDRLQFWGEKLRTSSRCRLGCYSLVGFDADGGIMPLSWYGTTSNSTNTAPTDAAAASARTFNTTNGFNYSLGMRYYASGTNLSASGLTPDSSILIELNGMDLRYDDNLVAVNCAETNIGLATGKPVYVRGVIKDDGLFYVRPFDADYGIVKGYYYNGKFYRDTGHSSAVGSLSGTFTYFDIATSTYYKCTNTSTPTFVALTADTLKTQKKFIRCTTQIQPTTKEYDADGYQYVYWYIGTAYYNGSYPNGGFQVNLCESHALFRYNGESFCQYEPDVYWDTLKDKPETFTPSAHEHSASDIVSGTLPISRGGTGATTAKGAQYSILDGINSATDNPNDGTQIVFHYTTPTTGNGALYYRNCSYPWNYIKSKILGGSSSKGNASTPIYLDSNGNAQECSNWKQSCVLNTHWEGDRTSWLDGVNSLFAFFDRGGTSTAYEYNLEYNSSSLPGEDAFKNVDLTDYKTTTTVGNINADLFSSRVGYSSTSPYSGSKFAVYDLVLPTSFSYSTRCVISFGNGSWAPKFFEVLVYNTGWNNTPAQYVVAKRQTGGPGYAYFDLPTTHTQADGTTKTYSINRIRIVMSKWSRWSTFIVNDYSCKGQSVSYMSRSTNDEIYRNISPAITNKYDLGTTAHKFRNVYATTFTGDLSGNASTASAAKSGSALETSINGKVTANTSITGATKCKVTYDSKGLVTAGADLAANDIPNLDASKITTGTFADARIASASVWNGKQDDISDLLPTAASATNQLCDKAYADAIGERLEARYIGSNAAGDPFPTHAALVAATTFYYQGSAVTPDTNDITTVIADEDHKNSYDVACPARYRFNGTATRVSWAFEYVINNTALSTGQLLAINSGITDTKVGIYDGYATGKQDKLSNTDSQISSAVTNSHTHSNKSKLDKYAGNKGSASVPVYIANDGTPTACTDDFVHHADLLNKTVGEFVCPLDDTYTFTSMDTLVHSQSYFFYSKGTYGLPENEESNSNIFAILAEDTAHDGKPTQYRFGGLSGGARIWTFDTIIDINLDIYIDEIKAIKSGITRSKVSTYDGYATSKQNTISDLDTIRTNAATGATALQPSGVQAYAKTGSGISVGVSVPANAVFTDTTYPEVAAGVDDEILENLLVDTTSLEE